MCGLQGPHVMEHVASTLMRAHTTQPQARSLHLIAAFRPWPIAIDEARAVPTQESMPMILRQLVFAVLDLDMQEV